MKNILFWENQQSETHLFTWLSVNKAVIQCAMK